MGRTWSRAAGTAACSGTRSVCIGCVPAEGLGSGGTHPFMRLLGGERQITLPLQCLTGARTPVPVLVNVNRESIGRLLVVVPER